MEKLMAEKATQTEKYQNMSMLRLEVNRTSLDRSLHTELQQTLRVETEYNLPDPANFSTSQDLDFA